ncbi:PREDICTED: protein-lysine methyltransferase METTL21D-like [Ceratosolen solmsi marchali]|uniref:Protein-lysine methyltransferase METTL21D-like n=1 Tax=Ceratosolen solmsi marchali TaxID=326594 RepID=A0AAJ6YKP2_9HYME|nr:PREDICTED: protein-lysine methyltransferase METTL21D-like [Ceratosolen solmsi marchali]
MKEDEDDTFVRELELESCNVTLKFFQKKVGDVSCVIWDAALVLAKYLDLISQNSKWLQGKQVLELGAGLGCAGLTASCLGAHVVLTDLESVVPMLKKNIIANEKQWRGSGGTAKAQILEWGKKIDLDFKPEIVLLTDCIYYEESIKPLLDTLENLCNSDNGTYAILSQEERETPKQIAIWKDFLTELNNRFKVKIIPISEQHPTFSNFDIHLMKIFKM